MTTQEALWAAVEKAGPDDPHPLLVLADYLHEQGEQDGEFNFETERALRWCAGRKLRPHRRTDVIKESWIWWCDVYRPKMTKAKRRAAGCAKLPEIIADLVLEKAEWGGWCKARWAYESVGYALTWMTDELSVPDVVLPSPRVIQLPDTVACPGCGIVRNKGTCAFCKREDDA